MTSKRLSGESPASVSADRHVAYRATARRFRHYLATVTVATLAFTITAQANELPDTMTWTSFDIGSAGYAEASAIANAFGKEYGTRVRILPAGSGIGTLQPIVQGRADYGFLASEAFFSSEGTYDFANRRWGPQNLRALAGRPSSFGMPTAADANIRSIADLEGKRVAYVAGNPSTNVKCDAILAFANLTREDVQAVMFPTFGAAMSSLAQDRADAACSTTTSTQLYELAESPRDIYWLDIPADDKEGWARMREIAPFFRPFTETVGAGISQKNPVSLVAYSYPELTTTADRDADEVYAVIKALDETYGMYKDSTAVTPRWDLEMAGTPPIGTPFHEGAIRYLKEIGVWTDEHQAWNDARVARLDALLSAWERAIAEGKDVSDEEFTKLWEQHRQQALANLE
ncbi:TAXI family TRAP transporter solute-binding subunit [Aurantimonas sp. C2-6-R+9]|uniref:TAXI family TRAP transporter solute-binding subunit n=1 Tax=unclassified Aurantimonas TaxID=2638230 RepID=UPI002E1839B9|nr:TAXI family TRAP transporter solute-binding subunit [Aurantimonas sp. C2-6-R+9]